MSDTQRATAVGRLERCSRCKELRGVYLELRGPEVLKRCAGCDGLRVRERALQFIEGWYAAEYACRATWEALRDLGLVKGEPDWGKWRERHPRSA